jgi:hypothetical protein
MMFKNQGDKCYEAVTCRGGFTVKLMELKLQGSSLTQALSKALEKPSINIHLCTKFCILFLKGGLKNCISLRPHKTWIRLCTYILLSIYTWHMGSRWYTSDLHRHH